MRISEDANHGWYTEQFSFIPNPPHSRTEFYEQATDVLLQQWKRERLAPSFHFDDLNVDPRSWCRFPILSGGYDRELAELKKLAQ